MKLIIVFACLLAMAFANEESNVVKEYSEVNVDNFKYGYDTDKDVKISQEGHLGDNDAWNVKGDFEYTAPGGEKISLTYTADETGYHPDPASPLLPTSPPIPEYILRAIAYIEAHPSKDAQ